jgi:mycothiol synthase
VAVLVTTERRRHPYVESRFEHQLEMVRPSPERVAVPAVPDEYRLRTFAPGDEAAYQALFHLAWPDEGALAHTLRHALPGGFVVIDEFASGALVASCVAFGVESPDLHPNDGSLGWLVVDPAHAHRGLGRICAATVTNRLLDEGYAMPWLGTEDDRLVAIGLYLRLGWEPSLYADGMQERWTEIKQRLAKPA